ncbi:MAG: hypothetical protein KKD77_21290 [Gammaproteobacteria bacterium]|nr:hypothetical protein [Gammaproteobacteria bacterium]
MDPVTVVLGGVVIAVASGTIGKYIGGNGKISEKHCDEKRASCQGLIVTKIDNLTKVVDELKKAVNNKLLGIL